MPSNELRYTNFLYNTFNHEVNTSKYGVFIVESVSLDDEEKILKDGLIDVLGILASVFQISIDNYSYTTKNSKRDNTCIKEFSFDAEGKMQRTKHKV